MKPYCYKAKVLKVYDGDTITVSLDLGFGVSMISKIRLAGINTPEVRGAERQEGLKSRDYLRALILHKNVIITTERDKKGKYGRYIGVIYLDNMNVNELLVEKKLAEKKVY